MQVHAVQPVSDPKRSSSPLLQQTEDQHAHLQMGPPTPQHAAQLPALPTALAIGRPSQLATPLRAARQVFNLRRLSSPPQHRMEEHHVHLRTAQPALQLAALSPAPSIAAVLGLLLPPAMQHVAAAPLLKPTRSPQLQPMAVPHVHLQMALETAQLVTPKRAHQRTLLSVLSSLGTAAFGGHGAAALLRVLLVVGLLQPACVWRPTKATVSKETVGFCASHVTCCTTCKQRQ
jgi:hypothetical protein